jgi:hypothetical protein
MGNLTKLRPHVDQEISDQKNYATHRSEIFIQTWYPIILLYRDFFCFLSTERIREMPHGLLLGMIVDQKIKFFVTHILNMHTRQLHFDVYTYSWKRLEEPSREIAIRA